MSTEGQIMQEAAPIDHTYQVTGSTSAEWKAFTFVADS